MIVAGYTVLVERGKWINYDMLYNRHENPFILGKLARLIENPGYPAYLQNAPLNKILRIKLGNDRLYARVWPAARMLTILAVLRRHQVKSDERGGAIDSDLSDYLITHTGDFLPDRFTELKELLSDYQVAEKTLGPAVPEEPSFPVLTEFVSKLSWEPIYKIKPLSELEATQLLLSCHGSAPGDPFCLQVWMKTLQADPTEKIVVSLPYGSDSWEKDQIKTLQKSLTRTLHYFGREYSVRFDDIARKFLVVPTDKIDVYCSRRGRRALRAA